ncbi:MAG: hypothetical protein IKR49_02340 [Clostridia bacterium]|nr:hypothetical protein [Clostridia bacterium]
MWKNQKMKWSELLSRLETPTRTQETVAEFRKMPKKQQDDRKDVGGFVGGYLKKGRRLGPAVRHRDVLCLDADFATQTLWSDWSGKYGTAAAVYSTHKHTPEAPRLRLVIPLSRQTTPDEYQAVGRRIAEQLGIDQFDDTTYEPARFMYWPSCSRDAEYVFDFLDAPLLDVDAVLATYYDWTDVTAWPFSSRAAEAIRKTTAKQEDPLEKDGLVGAFCRAYFPIGTAIDRFVESYEPCGEGRYTYTEGSTAGGVVVYGDKYIFSHHATDPASGHLCNAFDLVRLHRFGGLDEACDPDTPSGGRPSYKAMMAFAGDDADVKAQMYKDRMSDYDDDYTDDADDLPLAWTSRLKTNGKGAIAQTIENAKLVLSYDPKLAGCVATDKMAQAIVVQRDLPWRAKDEHKNLDIWHDSDDAALRLYMEKLGLTGKDRIFDALNIVADEHGYHPVRDYLDGCVWDGVERLDTLLVDYLGAEDTPYTRTVTRKTFVGAVARIYNPGCKFDYMLTIRGRQGIGKSALIARMGGSWFSDSVTTVQGKESYEQLQGVWIVEMSELASLRKSEVEQVKIYISKPTDRYRPAYGRRTMDAPRQCIFIGTTNETLFLRDTTGNRRFWVVDTPNKPAHSWRELTDDLVQQLWAEAVHRYDEGETLFLDEEMEAVAEKVQASFEEEDARVGIIADYLDRALPYNWENLDTYERREWLDSNAVGTIRRDTVCTLEIYCEALRRDPAKIDNYELRMISQILAKFPDWEYQGDRFKRTRLYKRQRYYKRIGADEAAEAAALRRGKEEADAEEVTL